MSRETFSDASMLEIFRAEVETHVEAMTSGLLALERDPGDTSHIDEMMRGAHSIKGAARIVGIDPAVRVAHVMEDGFIAAQKGALTLRPDHVDVLLRGVDMLSRIANASKADSLDWTKFDAEAAALVAEIGATLAGGAPAAVKSAVPALPNTNVSAAPTTEAPSAPTAAASVATVIPLAPLFDSPAAEVARQAYVEAWYAGVPTVQFNLAATRDFDAVGLAFLAAAATQTAPGAPRVSLINVNSVSDVLAATGVDRLYAAGGH